MCSVCSSICVSTWVGMLSLVSRVFLMPSNWAMTRVRKQNSATAYGGARWVCADRACCNGSKAETDMNDNDTLLIALCLVSLAMMTALRCALAWAQTDRALEACVAQRNSLAILLA